MEIRGLSDLGNKVKEEMGMPVSTSNAPIETPTTPLAYDDDSDEVSIALVENTNRVCVRKLTMRELLDELVRPFISALNAQGYNSIATSTFGFLGSLEAVPKNMRRVTYPFMQTTFFVQKNSSREAYIYGLVSKAAQEAKDNVFYFPLVQTVTLKILGSPKDEIKGRTEDEFIELPVSVLTFTEEEIKYLSFSFIESISLSYNKKSIDPYKDARLVFKINREVLGESPYVR